MITKIKNSVIRHLLKYKITGCCLYGSILFHEQLKKRNIDTNIIMAYSLHDCDNQKWATCHVWVESNNIKYDIGGGVRYLLFKDLRNVHKRAQLKLSLTLDGYPIIHDYTYSELDDQYLIKKFNLYIKDPKLYWNINLNEFMKNDYDKETIKNVSDEHQIIKKIRQLINKECLDLN